jgi:hypothetical protein
VAWSMSKNDFPGSVRSALETAPEYAHAELVDGFFEREVDLGSAGRNSQTDLMVVAGLDDTLGIIAVEKEGRRIICRLCRRLEDDPWKAAPVRGAASTLSEDLVGTD